MKLFNNVTVAPYIYLDLSDSETFITLPPGWGAEYCDKYVRLSACNCIAQNHTAELNFTNFFCMLPVAQSISDGVGITLCTSSFVGDASDVKFSYHRTNGLESSMMLCLEEFTRWRYQLDVKATTVVKG